MFYVITTLILKIMIASGEDCSGVETYEKIAMAEFDKQFESTGVLIEYPDQALTKDCINLCTQKSDCLSFGLDYNGFKCNAYSINSNERSDLLIPSNSSNLFEKVCYEKVSKADHERLCGGRLWTFERIDGAFLEGHHPAAVHFHVSSRLDCAQLCLSETEFICLSADYNSNNQECSLLKEDRRTLPQAFRMASGHYYLSNQCAYKGPVKCLYEKKQDVSLITMDALEYAENSEECQSKCDNEKTFNCHSYSFSDNKCILSGDDHTSLDTASLPIKDGAHYGEKVCPSDQCADGILTYEKISGYKISSAITLPMNLTEVGLLGITGHCKEACDSQHLACPAFSVDYENSKCLILDRNTQGRTLELISQPGQSTSEKICLQSSDAMKACKDKWWAFERVMDIQLADSNYIKETKYVQSIRDCMQMCLEEKDFVCKSALYNEESTACKLSPDDRLSAKLDIVFNENPKICYLENKCAMEPIDCTFKKQEGRFLNLIDLVIENPNADRNSCERLCLENKHFLCRSFTIDSAKKQCLISGDDTQSGGLDNLKERTDMVYYERRCGTSTSDGPDTINDTTNPIETTTIINESAQPTEAPVTVDPTQTPETTSKEDDGTTSISTNIIDDTTKLEETSSVEADVSVQPTEAPVTNDITNMPEATTGGVDISVQPTMTPVTIVDTTKQAEASQTDDDSTAQPSVTILATEDTTKLSEVNPPEGEVTLQSTLPTITIKDTNKQSIIPRKGEVSPPTTLPPITISLTSTSPGRSGCFQCDKKANKCSGR